MKKEDIKKIDDWQNLLEIGKAQEVRVVIIQLPDSDEWQTQIWIAGKRFEWGWPVPIIAHLCEWLGFMLSQLRMGIEKGLIDMTKEEFIQEVSWCKKHIEKALIDYN